ncbi:MAG: LysM peptidoglycan-binding domain-containing protein [Natronincolaceae bacterium]|jgi:N-acetylmuramoyl-L-alanine amidase|nr:LysM peptidoglycan-binding domain-containing protein [Bacillota bacterium]NLK91392.1 LysM peptidoglycan-binding domain-containing protein [Clostridiales bacterium]
MVYSQQSCPGGTTPYTIRAGDTFYKLSISHNVSLSAMLAANPGVNPDRLSIGQVICIPRGPTPPSPPTGACPTLSIGSRGASVARLQQLLINEGYNPGSVDGIFGPRTQSAVMAFQRDTHIPIDGIVGVRTWTALGVNCGVTPPHACPSGTTPYTIRAGDTFYLLSIRFGTTVGAIVAANPGVNPNALQIGQVVCIPR